MRSRLRVLHSPTDDSNPFFAQLARSCPPDIESVSFAWRIALVGRYHILHVHWPERLMRADTRQQRWLRLVLCSLLLLRLQVLRTPVLRTLHNSSPHDPPSRVERLLLAWFDRRTRVWVTMTDSTPPRSGTRVIIPHGSYEGWYPFDRSSRGQPDRLLYFGRIRPYKGITDLLDLYTSSFEPPWVLRLAGRPTTPALVQRLTAAVASDRRVSGLLRFVEDDELVTELAAARAIVLPHSGMENSGSLLLALSAHRPVIAPKTPSNIEIRDEVGAEWLHLYPEPLTRDELSAAWESVLATESRRTQPRLEARNWSRLGPQYAAAYRLARGRT